MPRFFLMPRKSYSGAYNLCSGSSLESNILWGECSMGALSLEADIPLGEKSQGACSQDGYSLGRMFSGHIFPPLLFRFTSPSDRLYDKVDYL